MQERREIRMHCTISGMFAHWQLAEAQRGTFLNAEFGKDGHPYRSAIDAGAKTGGPAGSRVPVARMLKLDGGDFDPISRSVLDLRQSATGAAWRPKPLRRAARPSHVPSSSVSGGEEGGGPIKIAR